MLFCLGDVPATNIFNYGRTNLQDDPGRNWVFVRRGRKRVENLKDTSKTSILVMWHGSAATECLLPMVVYKAENLYQVWVQGGLQGTIYDCTKSGWFDSSTFEIWFFKIFMEKVKQNPGKYVLFGNNLASHFSINVVKAAEQNNVHFVMLPPNAIHLLQPLHVVVFSSLKRVWRVILDKWKKEVRMEGSFNKKYFPSLLKCLVNTQGESMKINLQSRFRACGICPLDPNEPLSKLPSLDVSESNSSLNETLIELLKKNRGFDSEKQKRTHGKKIYKPGEVLSPTMFEEHAMRSSPETKRKKEKNNGNINSTKEGNSDDTWKCKSCNEIWHGQDDDGIDG